MPPFPNVSLDDTLWPRCGHAYLNVRARKFAKRASGGKQMHRPTMILQVAARDQASPSLAYLHSIGLVAVSATPI